MSGQGSIAIEGRWCRSKSLEALYGDSSGGSQDTYKACSNTSLHNNAQSNLNRVSDSISTAGIYFEYTFGSSQTSSNKHARVSLPQYIPDIVSLLLGICSNIPAHYRPSSWCFSASKSRNRSGIFNSFCCLGSHFLEVSEKVRYRTWL